MVYKRSPFLFVGLLTLVSSLAVKNVPVATAVSNEKALLGLSPTPAPDAGELRRRQASQVTVQTLLAAPDNTCGFFRGNSGSSPASRNPETSQTNVAKQLHHGDVQVEIVSSRLQQQVPHRMVVRKQGQSYAVIPQLAAQQHRPQQHA